MKKAIILLFSIFMQTNFNSEKKFIEKKIREKEIQMFELTQKHQLKYAFLAALNIELKQQKNIKRELVDQIEETNLFITELKKQKEGLDKIKNFLMRRIEQEMNRYNPTCKLHFTNVTITSLRKEVGSKLREILQIKKEIKKLKQQKENLTQELDKSNQSFIKKKIEKEKAQLFLKPIYELFDEIEELRKQIK